MESNFPSRVRCSRKLTARVQGYAAGEKLLRTISCQLLTEIAFSTPELFPASFLQKLHSRPQSSSLLRSKREGSGVETDRNWCFHVISFSQTDFFFLNSAFASVFISEFAHLVFPVVAFPHSYLNIVTVTSVAICPIRQTLVIRYFRFGIHQVVG